MVSLERMNTGMNVDVDPRPPPLRDSWLPRLCRRLGLRQRFRRANARYEELDVLPLWDALYGETPRGYKDYCVRFDDGFTMRLRQTRERSYEDIRGPTELFHLKRIDAVLEERQRVLDAACGSGYTTRWLAGRVAEAVGLELSEEAITYARHRYPRLTFARGDVCAIPFADASFDAVVSVETIEHLADPDSFVAEVARTLRQGGLWFVTTPVSRENPSPFHVREFSRKQFAELVATRFPDRQRWRWLVDDGRWMELLARKT